MQSGINHTYGIGIFGGGVSFFDFNKDGWDDITLATGDGDPLEFYINNQGTFTKMVPPPVYNIDQVKQTLWADYDNDGDYDLLVTSINSGVTLYHNFGNLTLVDVTVPAGLYQEFLQTFSGTWADFDNDGYLDIYLGCNNLRNYLYRNTGNGTFEDITLEAGVTDSSGLALAHVVLDYNKDGLHDIFIANDKWTPNKLFINAGEEGFYSTGNAAQAEIIMDAMSATVGDYDNNGWLDIYVTNNISGGGDLSGLSALFQNNGDGTYNEVASAAGVTFGGFGWSSQFLDADNDLDLDLYVSGKITGSSVPSSEIYENQGDGTFLLPINAGFVGDTVRSFGNAVGDYNNDGYQDIFVSNHLYPSQLWSNNAGGANWLKVFLEGVESNRDGIGSWLEAYIQGTKLTRFAHCGESYLAQNSQYHHFGLGSHSAIDSLKIIWPSGMVSVLENVGANQLITVVEGTLCSESEIIVSNSLIIYDNGEGTGSIFAEFDGGSPPYNFSWSNGSTSATIDELSFGFYDLTITDANDCESFFQFAVGLEISTGIDQLSEIGFTVGPNPFHDFIELSGNVPEKGKIEIFDLNGKLILAETLNQDRLQFNFPLPEGVYIFRLWDDETPIAAWKMVKH